MARTPGTWIPKEKEAHSGDSEKEKLFVHTYIPDSPPRYSTLECLPKAAGFGVLGLCGLGISFAMYTFQGYGVPPGSWHG